MNEGRVGEQQLLSREAVKRALAPGRPFNFSTGFKGLHPTYGQQWILYHPEPASGRPLVFGHAGSDGTYSWAWPDRDLIVLFFTQSRGSLAGIELEGIVHRLFGEGDVDGVKLTLDRNNAGGLTPYEGVYWDEDIQRAYYVIRSENNRLVMERPGAIRVALVQAAPDRFHIEGTTAVELFFEREGDAPAHTLQYKTATRTERQVRHKPDGSLPAGPAIAARVRDAHGISRLIEGVKQIRMKGTVELPARNQRGTVIHTFSATDSRLELEIDGRRMAYIVQGDLAFHESGSEPRQSVSGVEREQMLLDHPAVLFGNWSSHYPKVDVLRQISEKGRELLLVRTEPREARGSTKIIDVKTGLLAAHQTIEFLPGAGFVGVQTTFEDYREVRGMQLPFRVVSQYATSLMGELRFRFEIVEVEE
jgi:hypothetical protein